MKGETFTSEVTGATREVCQAAALVQARGYFGGSGELEIVGFDVRQVPNPDLRLSSPTSKTLAATVKVKEKAQGGKVWFL